MGTGERPYLVTYFSQSGSTRRVADAIYEALPEPKEIRPMDRVERIDGYRLAFVGFPLWEMGPAPPAEEFLRHHCSGGPIAVFYTQGNAPDFWQDKEVQARLHQVCAGNIVERFACQGEVPDSFIQFMEADPAAAEFAARARETRGLPSEESLEKARAFARRLAGIF